MASSKKTTPKPTILKRGVKKNNKKKKDNIDYSKRKKLNNIFKITKNSLIILKNNWQLYGLLLSVYFLLSLFFVHGFSLGVNLSEFKSTLSHQNSLYGGTSLVNKVIQSTGGTTTNAGVYQTLFGLVITLAVIYSLREIYAKRPVNLKDSFYKGMYSIIPSTLILVLIAIELIPLLLAAVIYAYFFGTLISISLFIKIPVVIVCLLLILLTCFWLSTSIIAFYISTLPDMTPFASLRYARDLVKKRRLKVFSRIVLFILLLFLVIYIIMVPISLYLTFAATWIYFILSLASLILFNCYMYSLYRELI